MNTRTRLLLLAAFLCLASTASVSLSSVHAQDDLWVVYEGSAGPGLGKHIVFVTGDDEYRSEEGMPMLARILAFRYGFKTTVLFAIDPESGEIKPDYQRNIPGLEALDSADLMVLFTRFRALPDEQMKHIVDYTNSGKPIIGLRTATHAFNYPNDVPSSYRNLSFNSSNPRGGYGRAVLGDTWISHHGGHGRQSTRGIINPEYANDPVVKGATDIWGPSDVYGIRNLTEDAEVLVYGLVLTGMSPEDPPLTNAKNAPMMPLVWRKTFEGETGNTNDVICTTMGAATDLESEGLRRLLVNACFSLLEMTDSLPADEEVNVDYVGDYDPTNFGFGSYRQGVKPSDLRWPLED